MLKIDFRDFRENRSIFRWWTNLFEDVIIISGVLAAGE